MANSNNVYGTEQPLRENISDWVGNQENLNLAQREEQRKVEALAEAKKLRDEKARKDLEESYALKVGPATGIASFDQAYNEFYTDAMNKNQELYKKERAGQPLTNDELVMKKNLQNLPEKLALLSKSYVDNNKIYNDWVKAGNHRDLDYEMTLNGMATNAKAFLDKQGNPVIGIDKDGDGKLDFLNSDLEGLSIKPNFTKAYDYDKEIKAIADNLAPERSVNESGYVKTTTEGLPIKIAKSAATASVYNPDGTPSDFAKSMLYPLNPNQITEKDLSALEGRITTSLINSKKRINERDVDYGAMNAAQREARQAKKDNKDMPVIGTPVTPSEQAWGRQYNTLNTREYLSVPVAGGEVKLPALSIKTGNEIKKGVKKPVYRNVTDAVIENYTYNKDGNLVVDYSYPTDKISVKGDDGVTTKITGKAKGQTEVNTETEARIANQLGMTVQELKASASNPNASKETPAERALRIANGG